MHAMEPVLCDGSVCVGHSSESSRLESLLSKWNGQSKEREQAKATRLLDERSRHKF